MSSISVSSTPLIAGDTILTKEGKTITIDANNTDLSLHVGDIVSHASDGSITKVNYGATTEEVILDGGNLTADTADDVATASTSDDTRAGFWGRLFGFATSAQQAALTSSGAGNSSSTDLSLHLASGGSERSGVTKYTVDTASTQIFNDPDVLSKGKEYLSRTDLIGMLNDGSIKNAETQQAIRYLLNHPDAFKTVDGATTTGHAVDGVISRKGLGITGGLLGMDGLPVTPAPVTPTPVTPTPVTPTPVTPTPVTPTPVTPTPVTPTPVTPTPVTPTPVTPTPVTPTPVTPTPTQIEIATNTPADTDQATALATLTASATIFDATNSGSCTKARLQGIANGTIVASAAEIAAAKWLLADPQKAQLDALSGTDGQRVFTAAELTQQFTPPVEPMSMATAVTTLGTCDELFASGDSAAWAQIEKIASGEVAVSDPLEKEAAMALIADPNAKARLSDPNGNFTKTDLAKLTPQDTATIASRAAGEKDGFNAVPPSDPRFFFADGTHTSDWDIAMAAAQLDANADRIATLNAALPPQNEANGKVALQALLGSEYGSALFAWKGSGHYQELDGATKEDLQAMANGETVNGKYPPTPEQIAAASWLIENDKLLEPAESTLDRLLNGDDAFSRDEMQKLIG